jgi:hypothetical protein
VAWKARSGTGVFLAWLPNGPAEDVAANAGEIALPYILEMGSQPQLPALFKSEVQGFKRHTLCHFFNIFLVFIVVQIIQSLLSQHVDTTHHLHIRVHGKLDVRTLSYILLPSAIFMHQLSIF